MVFGLGRVRSLAAVSNFSSSRNILWNGFRSFSAAASPPTVVVLLGKPGGGKGTISKWLVEDFSFTHLSTGDILRHEVAEKSDLGVMVETFIKNGDLVPDQLISDVVVKKIHQVALEDNARLLLDGFPRTINQAHMLEAAEKEDAFSLSLVACLDVPSSEIVERLSDRWVHEDSGRVYSYSFKPPQKEGLDDVTAEPLVRRSDDEPETIAHRLTTYDHETFPLIEYYQQKGVLQHFSGAEFPELVQKDQRSKAIYKELSAFVESVLVQQMN